MLNDPVGSPPFGASGADAVLIEPPAATATTVAPTLAEASADDGAEQSQTVREQLARDIADIESATAVLRRAEPALESWTDSPATALRKPGPVWFLIGLLWLSTALAVGAVVAIATFAG